MRHGLPKWRQRLNRIEHAGEKSQRHDQEILENRQLIELVRPDAGDQAHGAKQRCAEEGKNNNPPRRHKGQIAKPGSDHKYAETNRNATHHRGQHIAAIQLPVRQRRQQDKHQIAGHFRLCQRRRGIGEGILQHAHHYQAGNQERSVLHARINFDVVFQRVAENQQVQQGCQDRRTDGLRRYFPEAQHFLVKQRLETYHHLTPPALYSSA